MVIAILSAKGGVGKSTVALNLAGALASRKSNVLLIDADEQGSISRWADISEQRDFTVLVEPEAVIHENIDVASSQYDTVLIDTPPSFREQLVSVMRSADRVIVPVSPSLQDVWSTEKLLGVYKEVEAEHPELDIRLLISKVDKRRKVGQEFRSYLETLGVPIFRTEISDRVAYVESFMAGLTIDKYDPKGDTTREFMRLASEVRKWTR